MSWRQPNLRGRDEGSVAVETAIILTALMFLLFGIIEFTVGWYQLNTMSLAVAKAGRYVMVNCQGHTLQPCSSSATYCDTSCAETQMQAILTKAAICTTPANNQTCVTAALKTNNTTNGMTLTASYGFNFVALTGPLKLTSSIWVPLD